jgi:hypothetical protein
MSRSRHTDPRRVRAVRRLSSPRAHLSEGDASGRMRVGRALKESGLLSTYELENQKHVVVWPRIVVPGPTPGFYHPATQGRVQEILEALGPTGVYGLKTVKLSRHSEVDGAGPGLLARYISPDRIMLFERKLPPWHYIGRLSDSIVDLFERSGAEVCWSDEASATTVDWPGDTLARFILVEGLMHEIGHYIKQHEARARTRRIARTRDHEAFARMYAARVKGDLPLKGISV